VPERGLLELLQDGEPPFSLGDDSGKCR